MDGQFALRQPGKRSRRKQIPDAPRPTSLPCSSCRIAAGRCAAHPGRMTTIRQARVPAGVPTGGRFAVTASAESEIDLTDNTPEVLDRLTDQYLDTYEEPGTAAERDAVQQTLDMAYESARHWEYRKGVRNRSGGLVDEDDIAQEAMLAVLEREANGHVIHDPKAYMHTYSWGIAQQAGNLGVRQENRKALRMFNEECDRREAARGEPLTSAEKDQVAVEIRDNWHDQKRKPSVDFRRYAGRMEVSMDAQESQDAANYLLPNSVMGQPGEENQFEVRPGSYTDRALDAVDGINGDRRLAKRMLWNVLAENSDHGTPLVQVGTLSQRKVTAVRAAMAKQAGGVLGAADAWESGQSDESTEALFAPWGTGASVAEQQAVVDQMRRYPDRAEALWTSALQLANTRHAATS